MTNTPTVRELYDHLNERIPRTLSCPWDNDGLMICPDGDAPVSKLLVTLDATEEMVDLAIAEGYNAILTHHPLIFHGVKAVDGGDTVTRKAIRLIRAGVSVMSFHTRLDTVAGGVNDTLAARLGLVDVTPFGDNDNPAGACMGRIGSLPSPMALRDFAAQVKDVLGAPAVWVADAGRSVSRVAVLGGGGSGDEAAARAAGADTFLTGELKHNQLCDAPYGGMNLLAAGHYHTEFPVCDELAALVKAWAPDLTVTVRPSDRVLVL